MVLLKQVAGNKIEVKNVEWKIQSRRIRKPTNARKGDSLIPVKIHKISAGFRAFT